MNSRVVEIETVAQSKLQRHQQTKGEIQENTYNKETYMYGMGITKYWWLIS